MKPPYSLKNQKGPMRRIRMMDEIRIPKTHLSHLVVLDPRILTTYDTLPFFAQ